MPYIKNWIEYDEDGNEISEAEFDDPNPYNTENDFENESPKVEGDKTGFHYEPAEAHFTSEKLKKVSFADGPNYALIFQTLQDLGVTVIHCTYEGGGDEGFAYFKEATINDQRVSVQDLAKQIVDGPLGNPVSCIWRLETPTRVENAQDNLDMFAHVLATLLVGAGYGTGEYSIRGAFHADFQTGQIVDERAED